MPRPATVLPSLLALAVLGCGDVARVDPSVAPTRGYLLISIDTLRADHLGFYGYPRDTSPFLDSLAGRGVVFENAFVQLPGTLPSHMSIFTGLYPVEHGVYAPAGVLSPEIETLPEAFRRAGYRTAGFTEGGYMHGGYGFARGFEEFDHDSGKINRDIEVTFRRGLDFLERLEPGERFFLFLHTYAVHDPYFPPEGYLERFWEEPAPETFLPTGPNLVEVNRGKRTVTPEALEYFVASYDASIRYMDDVVRDFYAELERLGLADETTIVLTSDHGEEFLEHGKLVHEQIYRETLHVPLLLLHPELEPRRVEEVVESIDLAPTLYRLARIEPATEPSGRSLLALAAGADAAEPRSMAYAERHDRRARSLVEDRGDGLYQLIFKERASAGEVLWVARSLTFDVFESDLTLEARPYHEPRELRFEVGGEVVARRTLDDPDAWQTVRVELPGAGKRRVTLVSEGCTVPAEVSESPDERCLSFRVRGVAVRNLELYDLRRDPRGERDLSFAETRVVRELLPRFEEYEREPRSSAEVRDLDPELEARLKALGYLQ